MKYKNNTIVVTCSSLALASALIFSTAVQAQPSSTPSSSSKSASGQSTNSSVTTPTQSVYGGTQSAYGEKANERTGALGQDKDKQKLQDQTKQEDTALNAKVASMNRAPEDQKLELMAGIITTMVEQRSAANARLNSDDQSQSMYKDAHPSASDASPSVTAPSVTAPSATTPYNKSKD